MDDLLHLDAVGHHHRQGRRQGQVEIDGDAVALGLDLQQRQSFANDGVDVAGHQIRLLLAHEVSRAGDDLVGPVGLLGNLPQGFENLGGLALLESQAPDATVGVAGNGRQRLVQLVGQLGRHTTDQGEARDVGQFGLQAPGLFLLLLAQGDVDEDGFHVALFGRKRDVDEQPGRGAVAAANLYLEAPHATTAQSLGNHPLPDRGIDVVLRGDEFGDEVLAGIVAEDLGRPAVGVEHGAIADASPRQTDLGTFKEITIVDLALAQDLFRLPSPVIGRKRQPSRGWRHQRRRQHRQPDGQRSTEHLGVEDQVAGIGKQHGNGHRQQTQRDHRTRRADSPEIIQ